jgi:hypothetical protein
VVNAYGEATPVAEEVARYRSKDAACPAWTEILAIQPLSPLSWHTAKTDFAVEQIPVKFPPDCAGSLDATR